MNLYHIITEIEKADEEFADRVSPRRKVMKDFFSFSGKLVLSAVPLALGSIFSKAYGQTVPSKVIDILNFALTLEYLEHNFYQTGLNKSGLVKNKDNIAAIREHERAHVKFLYETIAAAGGRPVSEGRYDFTAGGKFADVFTNYDTFLHVAQGFEDTGVRAYKAQASSLDSAKDIMKAALQIHSTEARHASHIRFARRMNGYNTSVKPWIVGNDNTTGTPYEAIYKGEEDNSQVIFAIENINGMDVGNAATSSFDEPLPKDDVMKIASMFILP
ncbi:MAG: ferritin-like domain-containing protein [Pedobacter sp.]|nr:ferritin-like domain-containing protein [Pedobacter sp.]MDQ8053852.1 ferritin-like domain-containing protein [Pedobacter sp.]